MQFGNIIICFTGVTRDSVLTLARASGKFTVSERWVPIAEIYEAALENRVCGLH